MKISVVNVQFLLQVKQRGIKNSINISLLPSPKNAPLSRVHTQLNYDEQTRWGTGSIAAVSGSGMNSSERRLNVARRTFNFTSLYIQFN